MASLWVRNDGEWDLTVLGTRSLTLRDTPAAPIQWTASDAGQRQTPGDVTLLRAIIAGQEQWLVMAGPEAQPMVNELPVFGMRLLAHKDELRVGCQQIFFSSEHLIRPQPFPAREGTFCARCGEIIAAGTMAVQCACGLWFHQSQEDGCWMYADRCCGCEAQTSIDSDYAWTPEGL